MDQPTYKLIVGIPGSSMAISIFEQISKLSNIPDSIAINAKQLLETGHLSYEKLLEKLDQQAFELNLLIRQNKQKEFDLINRAKALELEMNSIKEKELEAFNSKLEKILDKSKKLAEDLKNNKLTKNKFYDQVASIKSEIPNLTPQNAKENKVIKGKPVSLNEIIIGNKYYSTELNKEFIAKSVNTRKMLVLASYKSYSKWLHIEDIRDQNARPNQKIAINIIQEQTLNHYLDCRGLRKEEYDNLIDRYLISIENGDLPFVEIIHGHGNGILKSSLREKLKKYSSLEWKTDDGLIEEF